MHVVLLQDKVQADVIDEDIQNCVSTTASEVSKGLCRYPSGKWPVNEVYDAEDDMSSLR